jgi:hypothetical protein
MLKKKAREKKVNSLIIGGKKTWFAPYIQPVHQDLSGAVYL